MVPRTGDGLARVAAFMRANVLGVVAIFIALSGSAVAVTVKTAPPNSVATKSIRNGAVTGAKVARNTLTGKQIKESTLVGVNAAELGGLSSTAFQSRVSGTCNAGQAIRSVGANGNVVCEPVQTIGAGSVGAAQIDSSQVQKRVTGSCPLGEAVSAVGADGSTACAGSVGAVVKGDGTIFFGHGFTVTHTPGTGLYVLDWPPGTFDNNLVPIVQPVISGVPAPVTSISGYCSGSPCVQNGEVNMTVQFDNQGVSCPTLASCALTYTPTDPAFFSVILATAPSTG
jgi:hypothetical protein